MALDPLNSQTPMCTVDFIALHARQRPDHVAIICDDHETTYASPRVALTAMTAYMAGLGLPRGALVALAHPDIHARLLVALALERLGVTLHIRRCRQRKTQSVAGHRHRGRGRRQSSAGECGRDPRARPIGDRWLR